MNAFFHPGRDGVDGLGYSPARHGRRADENCPPWCGNDHAEPNAPHYSELTDLLVKVGGKPDGADGVIQVGMDQADYGKDALMVCLVGDGCDLWLTLGEARRLALTILLLDSAALGDAR